MSQFANTPESLLPRSDSRNPASTCRGINVNGKPCRRTLGASTRSKTASGGVVAVLKGQTPDPAAFYCWQHKSQASNFHNDSPNIRRQTDATASRSRSSIDSLVERLGILDIYDDQQKRRHTQPSVRKQHYEGPNRSSEKKTHVKESSFCCFGVANDSETLPTARRACIDVYMCMIL